MNRSSYSLIIVTWNSATTIVDCIGSLRKYLPTETEVIVVDNYSQDGTVQRIKEEFSEVKVIENNKNLGFARGCNIGWKQARGSYLIFLNPDTYLSEDPFSNMVGIMENQPKLGILGPKILNQDGSVQTSVRSFPRLADQILILLKLRPWLQSGNRLRRYLKPTININDGLGLVEQIMGACMVVKRQVIEQLGGFDEGYWIWFEEVDLCKRARDRGWQVGYYAGEKIFHIGGASFGNVGSLRKQWWWSRSLWRYAGKFWPWHQRILLLAVMPIGLTLVLLSKAFGR